MVLIISKQLLIFLCLDKMIIVHMPRILQLAYNEASVTNFLRVTLYEN